MKKVTSVLFLTLLIASLMTGCGGGGSSTSNNNENGDSNNSDVAETVNSDTDNSDEENTTTDTNNPSNSSFKYPEMFQNFDNFKSGQGFPIDRTFDVYGLIITVPFLSLQLSTSQAIGENDQLQRSSCEEGSASASGYYELDASKPTYSSAYGSLNFNTSSGIWFELIGSPEEDCSYNSFYDGYVLFDIDNFDDDSGIATTDITATLGTASAPFFLEAASGSGFDGSTAYTGTFNSEASYTSDGSITTVSTPSMEISTVDSNVSEAYTKGPYVEYDYAYYKNYTQTNTTTGEDTDNKVSSLIYSYEQQFEEDGEQYLLQVTKSLTRRFGVDSLTSTESFTLEIANDSSKTVTGTKVQESTDTQLSYTYTMTKGGVTETDTLTFGN